MTGAHFETQRLTDRERPGAAALIDEPPVRGRSTTARGAFAPERPGASLDGPAVSSLSRLVCAASDRVQPARRFEPASIQRMDADPAQTAEAEVQIELVVNDGITTNNPGLFSDLNGHFVLDNSNAESIDIGENTYFLIAQTCSVMSVLWLENEKKTGIMGLDDAARRHVVGVLLANASVADQVAWGTQRLGLSRYGSSANPLSSLPQGTMLLINSPRHVTAARRTANGFRYFDSETGEVADIDASEMGFYISQAVSVFSSLAI